MKVKTPNTDLHQKILEGVKKAVQKLIEETAQRDGELVISRNGKVVRVKAKDLLKETAIKQTKNFHRLPDIQYGKTGTKSAMSLKKTNNNAEFENIILLIQEAKSRAFAKVNEELVLLYYNVGKTVSEKVAAGAWGDGTVDELAKYIALKMPGLSGFNRRGIYRMMQFYEIYSPASECFFLWHGAKKPPPGVAESSRKQIVSALPTQLKKGKNQIGKP